MRRLICTFVVRIWQNRLSHDAANIGQIDKAKYQLIHSKQYQKKLQLPFPSLNTGETNNWKYVIVHDKYQRAKRARKSFRNKHFRHCAAIVGKMFLKFK